MADQPPDKKLLNQTLGELLHNNPQAQELIMQTMHITKEELQELIESASDNPMMNQTVGQLFQNGTIQEATQSQEHPQYYKPSFLQKLKNFFG